MQDPQNMQAGNDAADAFIARWRGVAASELSTSQSFLIDLCRLLGVDAPHPTPEQDCPRIGNFTTGDYVKVCAGELEALEADLRSRYGRPVTR